MALRLRTKVTVRKLGLELERGVVRALGPGPRRGVVLILLILFLGGCVPGPRSFRAPGPGLPPEASIAFLQLTNLSENEEATYLFTDKLLIELGRLQIFRVQDPGVVLGALRRLRILNPNRLSAEQMEALAAQIDAQYFLVGTITSCESRHDQAGRIPAAAITLRVTEASTGAVIWGASLARTGNDSESFFGVGRVRSLERLVEDMARDLAASMVELTEPGPRQAAKRE